MGKEAVPVSGKRSSRSPVKWLLTGLILLTIAATAFVIRQCLDLAAGPSASVPETGAVPETAAPAQTLPAPTEPSTVPTEPEPERVVATATISAQGDLLMHKPIFSSQSACWQEDGSYNFDSVFRYLTEYLATQDYSLANLETTFGGDAYPYQGWPLFNCPDPFADSLVRAGYDMILTANNHCYDTLMTGLNRSLELAREKGLDTLGTRLTQEEPRYSLVEVNGISLGMVCYTYTTSMQGDRPRLNGNSPVEDPSLVNYFRYTDLEGFYSELGGILAEMEAAGAQATILYIHWGEEYQLQENAVQREMAQKLCDMGIDVIVGGHPHVVQPVELLTGTEDPERKTVCLYSVGNAVSNQRRQNMNLNTGHTEDGLLVSMTFEQYSDGKVYLAQVRAVPTWVNMHNKNGGWEYNILPLTEAEQDQWQIRFELTDQEYQLARDSWQRTMDIVGPGQEQVDACLTQWKQDREAEYLRQARMGG